MKKKKFRTTIIDGVVYVMRDDVFFPVNEKKSSRLNSWITLDQITKEFPEFYDKIEDIFSKKYNERAKSFATNIMNFLEMDGFLSWKQFDCIWRICETYEDYMAGVAKGFYRYGSVVNIQRNGISLTCGSGTPSLEKHLGRKTTDEEMDSLYTKLCGHRPLFSEELDEGLTVDYDDERRFFSASHQNQCDSAFIS